MSKYTDDLDDQFRDIKKVKEATKDILEKGEKLAMEELHDARSFERLKKEIRRK